MSGASIACQPVYSLHAAAALPPSKSAALEQRRHKIVPGNMESGIVRAGSATRSAIAGGNVGATSSSPMRTYICMSLTKLILET